MRDAHHIPGYATSTLTQLLVGVETTDLQRREHATSGSPLPGTEPGLTREKAFHDIHRMANSPLQILSLENILQRFEPSDVRLTLAFYLYISSADLPNTE
jgi:hypothetical protein